MAAMAATYSASSATSSDPTGSAVLAAPAEGSAKAVAHHKHSAHDHAESEASTELGKFSEASMSDKASSHGGDVTPRGLAKKGGISKGGPRWSDLCDGLLGNAALEEDLTEFGVEDSPKSPTKSSRRANRRRRRREEAKAAALEEAEGFDDEVADDVPGLPGIVPRGTGSSANKMMLPAAAFMNAAVFVGGPLGSCSPTCIPSPARSNTLPSAAFPRADGSRLVPSDVCWSNPCRPRLPMAATMSSPTAGSGVTGDASTRTPTAGACASPYVRGVVTGTDASSRTPTAAGWAVVGSPVARNILSTSPMAMAAMAAGSPMAAASPTTQRGQPAFFPQALGSHAPPGSAAADALRTLLGHNASPVGEEMAAKLRAALPETYED